MEKAGALKNALHLVCKTIHKHKFQAMCIIEKDSEKLTIRFMKQTKSNYC